MTAGQPYPVPFYDRPAQWVAPELIGAWLQVGPCGGYVTEVEAYGRDDPASHSFRGPTLRNAAMFGPPGRAYVYRSYGIHWCLNVVCTAGEAVLIRAMEPQVGLSEMVARRAGMLPLALGPGRLAQALGITGQHDGRPFDASDFRLAQGRKLAVIAGPRIGISRACDVPWRFGAAGSPFLSRSFLAL